MNVWLESLALERTQKMAVSNFVLRILTLPDVLFCLQANPAILTLEMSKGATEIVITNAIIAKVLISFVFYVLICNHEIL